MHHRTIKRRQIIFLAAATTCLLAAIGFYFIRPAILQNKNQVVRDAIKRLQKQDSRLDVAKRSLWAMLPPSLTRRIPNFVPPPAVTVRREAARDLIKLRPQTDEAIQSLIEALKDQDSGVRFSATEALGEIGPRAKAAVPALIVQLQSKNQYGIEEPNYAIYALTRIAPEFPIVFEALLNLMNSRASRSSGNLYATSVDDFGIIRAVIYGFGLMGAKNPKAVLTLIKLFRDPESPHRAAAAKALGVVGAPAKDAVPFLIDLLAGHDPPTFDTLKYEAAISSLENHARKQIGPRRPLRRPQE